MNLKVFTHTDLDGYSCAILAQVAAGRDNVSAEYCGYYNINEKIKKFIDTKAYESYDLVFITDISINDEVAELIESINKSHNKFYLFDHHPTAIGLNKYDWCTVTIEDEIEKVCGTSLLYKGLADNELLKANKGLDLFVETVKRYDTWLWKEKYDDIIPKHLNYLFKIYGPERFSAMYVDRLYYLKNDFKLFTDQDTFLLELENEKIQTYIDKKEKCIYRKTLVINGRTYRAGIVVADDYLSELGNVLCERHPEYDFIAMVSGLSTVSYRTIKDDINLGAYVASYFGGGGHPKSAGSQISFDLKKQILDTIFEK